MVEEEDNNNFELLDINDLTEADSIISPYSLININKIFIVFIN
jgi:hypothetical protein